MQTITREASELGINDFPITITLEGEQFLFISEVREDGEMKYVKYYSISSAKLLKIFND